jgi:hypothetical protein
MSGGYPLSTTKSSNSDFTEFFAIAAFKRALTNLPLCNINTLRRT